MPSTQTCCDTGPEGRTPNVTCSGAANNYNKVCINLDSSTTDCGSCGNACDVGATCATGTCECPAGPTLIDSICCINADNAVCSGQCVDTLHDPKNCGGCGHDVSPYDCEPNPAEPGTRISCTPNGYSCEALQPPCCGQPVASQGCPVGDNCCEEGDPAPQGDCCCTNGTAAEIQACVAGCHAAL